MIRLDDIANFIARYGRIRVALPIEQQISELSLRPPVDLKPLIAQVDTAHHAAAFVFLMEQHLRYYPAQWRNPQLADFLLALAKAIISKRSRKLDETPSQVLSWQVFVDWLWQAGFVIVPQPTVGTDCTEVDIWSLVEACGAAEDVALVLQALVKDWQERQDYWAEYYNDTLGAYLSSLWGLLVDQTEGSQRTLDWRLAAELLVSAVFYE
ncbi:hypothetical protein GXSOP10_12112 [Armatimonadetes bacterium GXS]|nr:hypothetical protein GXSOP10_12112 [Armatimonadetes bacterium GXS]